MVCFRQKVDLASVAGFDDEIGVGYHVAETYVCIDVSSTCGGVAGAQPTKEIPLGKDPSFAFSDLYTVDQNCVSKIFYFRMFGLEVGVYNMYYQMGFFSRQPIPHLHRDTRGNSHTYTGFSAHGHHIVIGTTRDMNARPTDPNKKRLF